MKKWLSIAAVVVLCLAVVVGTACGDEEEEVGVKEVKLGIGTPLSGLYGTVMGIPAKQGYEIANEFIGEFTVDGQRYKWNLIFEENSATAAGGVAAATKLIFEDGVKIMAMHAGDPIGGAQPICEESGVIMLTLGETLGVFGPDKPYTFGGAAFLYPSWALLMKYISETHPEVKTVSLIDIDSGSGREKITMGSPAAEHFGIEWLEAEFYTPGTTEFYPIATAMANKDADMCHLGPQQLIAMRELGWDGIAFYTSWLPVFNDMLGDYADGYLDIYPEPYGEELPQAVKDIADAYKARYGEDFGLVPYYHAWQLYFLTDALQKAGTVDDVDKIIEVLETETLDTPFGSVKYGLSELVGIGHLLVCPTKLGEIRDGEYHLLDMISAEESEALTLEIYAK